MPSFVHPTPPFSFDFVYSVFVYHVMTRQTDEELRRQHQGMDRLGVCQVPEGSGEQGKMKKSGCEIICGAQTTFAVQG